MVKFGKLYKSIQTAEFKDNYIDYKKLKQKIKKIREIIPADSPSFFQDNLVFGNLRYNLDLSITNDVYNPKSNKLTINESKYNEQLVEFKNLLDKEFQKFFKFFLKIKRNLHKKLNKHLYTQTNYSNYKEIELLDEINNLRQTMYLAKCLNSFIHDNMMAIKKILKKFDKKFNCYFGNFGPKYILDNLCKENSDLEYLLQFKIIDETCCIIEDNTKLLKDCYLELVAGDGRKINRKHDNFFIKYNEIWDYLLDIDELIYFKIQYKEWFYYIKKDTVIKKKSSLYKNLMFNPILFSAFHKDDIMNKFLSRTDQIKEVESIQVELSLSNRINIIMIFIHTFFYNTLISGIYPLQIMYINFYQYHVEKMDKNYNLNEYSFLIISSTYICSYFSILIYHFFGKKRIKLSFVLSNIFFFFGSLFYIMSFNSYNRLRFFYTFLIASRVFIGFGANPLMGKKYILSFTPKYFLPEMSKIYIFVSHLGHAMGPFIVFILFALSDTEYKYVMPNIYYSKFNCLGWYGLFMSFILLFINIFCFTSPTSKAFKKLKSKYNNYEKEMDGNGKTPFLFDDTDDTEDKEFYKLQKEMIDKFDKKDDNSLFIEDNDIIKDNDDEIQEKNDNIKEINLSYQKISKNKELNFDINNTHKNSIKKTMSFNPRKSVGLEINYETYNKNPLLIINEDEEEKKDDANVDINVDSEYGNFVNINMIPRIIDDIKRKEKKGFNYINNNLLIILIILFFCNLLKENFVAYCCYYILVKKPEETLVIFEDKYLCLLISISYFVEFFSMFFILPLYKINTKLRIILVILMAISILLMIPIIFEIDLLPYFILITLIILISSFIEVLSSAYLAYLTPPDWKMSHINAGTLPFYIMNLGKLIGCLIGCISLIRKVLPYHVNNVFVLLITTVGYIISGVYILRSKNFRIKAICRIMRKAELDSFNFY